MFQEPFLFKVLSRNDNSYKWVKHCLCQRRWQAHSDERYLSWKRWALAFWLALVWEGAVLNKQQHLLLFYCIFWSKIVSLRRQASPEGRMWVSSRRTRKKSETQTELRAHVSGPRCDKSPRARTCRTSALIGGNGSFTTVSQNTAKDIRRLEVACTCLGARLGMSQTTSPTPVALTAQQSVPGNSSDARRRDSIECY